MRVEFLLFVLAFIAFVAGIVALAIWTHRKNQKRKEAFRTLCAAQGWSYLEKDAHDRPARFQGWTPFGAGHSRFAFNVVAGMRHGVPFEIFSYQYTTTTTGAKGQQHNHTHHFKILSVQMPLAAPNLRLSRETIGKKLFDALGGSDIDFESDEFSRKFWVQCDDRRFASTCITPEMMEYFLAQTSAWSWRWDGTQLLLVQGGVLEPNECLPALELVAGFIARIPRILVPKQKVVA